MGLSFAPRQPRDLALAGFLASALVVAAMVVGTYWLSAQERSAQSWISQTEETLAALASTQAHLAQLQNGVRGFVITGAEPELQPYEASRTALREDTQRLQQLTAGNPVQREHLVALNAQLAPRTEAADAVIAARRSGGFEAARAAMEQRAATQQQGRLRDVLDAMIAEEHRLLAQRLSWHETRLTAFWAGMAACVLGLLAALGTIYRQIRRQRLLEQALLEREQEFHFMTDSITECAVLMLDLQGRVRTWNPGAQRIKGYAASEVIGRHVSCFYTPEDAAAGQPEESLGTALRLGTWHGEGWRVRKGGSRFWASVVITPVRGRDGEVTGFCKITRDRTERKAAEEQLHREIAERVRTQEELERVNGHLEALVAERTSELQSTNEELRAAKLRLEQLSTQLISAQEQERRHIARELHDETGQALTLIRLNLAELAQQGTAAEGRVAQCVQHVDRAITHIRGLSVRLRPPMLDDLGLAAAIEWLVEQQAEAAGWRTRLQLPDGDERMPEQIETACFRICQEALTNAARYAQATEVGVGLRASRDELVVTVEDNGNGFDLERYRSVDERKKHFGLVSMTERAALAGGRLEIDTAPGRGTQVRAHFPLG